MSSPTLEARVVRITELVPGMREELGRHTAEIAELPRRVSAVKEGSVKTSYFLKLRWLVGMKPK